MHNYLVFNTRDLFDKSFAGLPKLCPPHYEVVDNLSRNSNSRFSFRQKILIYNFVDQSNLFRLANTHRMFHYRSSKCSICVQAYTI